MVDEEARPKIDIPEQYGKNYFRDLTWGIREGIYDPDEVADELSVFYANTIEEAQIDALTGLHNQGSFPRELAKYIRLTRRLDEKGFLLALDLKKFKDYNDRLGHDEGDRLISTFADLIVETTRDIDLKGRTHGDKFQVYMMGLKAKAAMSVAERIRDSAPVYFRERLPRWILNRQFEQWDWSNPVAIGVAPLLSNDDAEKLEKRADQALMKRAKLAENSIHFAYIPKSLRLAA